MTRKKRVLSFIIRGTVNPLYALDELHIDYRPKSLAEARLRRQAEKDLGVSNVTVTVTAGK